MKSVSIIVRAYNESAQLKLLLESLKSQDYPRELIEIVVVDNGSKDDTVSVAKEYGVKVIVLSQDDFSYPMSSNAGISAAAGEIIVLASAHSLPLSKEWLGSGLVHFSDEKVAGVYGTTLARWKMSWIESVATYPVYWILKLRGAYAVKKKGIGVLGATNCAIRKSLWIDHHFDESYGAGGEDTEWAGWALSKGLKVIFEPDFSVYHSHGHGIVGYIKQRILWHKLQYPRPFSKKELSFRKDIKE
ncbi:MAG: glycosyl transferase [Patescibacteria group bacterium]|jgi:glycosyltransferase involved in cell wall biosynthesis|nr:glycosyl transferase [Patescibacteria group bacterium]